jgi:hypothetical protein
LFLELAPKFSSSSLNNFIHIGNAGWYLFKSMTYVERGTFKDQFLDWSEKAGRVLWAASPSKAHQRR